MAENAPFLPGLSPVGGKPVHVAFDGGRLTSDAGVLLLAEIERLLGIAERLARCLTDPRAPERVRHTLAEMIVSGACSPRCTRPVVLVRIAGWCPACWCEHRRRR